MELKNKLEQIIDKNSTSILEKTTFPTCFLSDWMLLTVNRHILLSTTMFDSWQLLSTVVDYPTWELAQNLMNVHVKFLSLICLEPPQSVFEICCLIDELDLLLMNCNLSISWWSSLESFQSDFNICCLINKLDDLG